jgi:F-type H+-transporting ATPase subunit delta
MQGASRTSLAQLRDSLAGRAGVSALAEDLLAISGLLGQQRSLRDALGDPGTEPAVRAGIVESVLTGKVQAGAIDLVKEAVALRWSSGRDLTEAVAVLGADAALVGAEQAGRIDAVQDELFRFGRAVAANGELQLALGNPATPAQERVAVVRQLLAGRSESETQLLVEDAVRNPRGRRIDAAIDALVEQAAIRRQQLLAEVRSAIPLSEEQSTRLAAALTRVYGQPVQLQVVVDPSVLGGVSVTIGDEVIDGTTTHRLQQARRQLLGGQA